jgi:DNA modification methylase
LTDLPNKTELEKPENLIPYSNNPKEHPGAQIDEIASSIKNYGFVQPVVVDSENEVIIGHGRLKAAKKLGLDEIPVIRHDDISDSEAKALRLADNKIAESEWEDEKLAVELEQLTEADDHEELIHGFNEDEMSEYLDSLTDEEDLEEPESEDPEQVETDIQEGEVFKLGEHRLMCGDATIEEHVETLMDGNKADVVFTDPPYNVDYGGKNPQGWSEREDIAGDKQTDEEWLKFNLSIRNAIKTHSKKECDVYLCGAPGPDGIKQRDKWIEDGFHWSSTIIWVKQQFVFSRSNYHRRYEPIMYGWFGKSSYNGDATNDEVWEIDRPQVSEEHPTMKPVELVTTAIKNSSTRENIIVDLFTGSGTTLLAAEQTNRKAFCMELDPQYCQVIINRWEELTGKNAEPLT